MIFRNVRHVCVFLSIGLLSTMAYGMEMSSERESEQELLTDKMELGLGQDKPEPRAIVFGRNREPFLFIPWLIQEGYISKETLLGPEGQTPSYYALVLAEQSTEVLEFLLNNGVATVNQVDIHGRQLIHYAAYYNLEDTVDFLRSRGADMNALDGRGRTPLLYAAQGGAADVITTFSTLFDLDVTDDVGAGALHYSMLSFRDKFVLDLYALYVDRTYSNRDHMGREPIHYAAWAGFEDIFNDLADDQSRFGVLENHRIDISAIDGGGNNFFHYAALGGNQDISNHPLGLNSPLAHACNDDNKTPADIALENGHLAIANQLFREQLLVRNPEAIQHLLSRGLFISEYQEVGEGESCSVLEVALQEGDSARARTLWSWGIEWEYKEAFIEQIRQAFSHLEAQYTSLNNEGAPTWELPLMFLPCFYDEARVQEQLRRLKEYVDQEKENSGSYIQNLLKEVLLIAMAYGHLEEVKKIVSYIKPYGLVEEDTLRALFLRSVLVSSEAAAYSYSLLDPHNSQRVLAQGLRLAFGQRQFDSIRFFLLEQHVPTSSVLDYPYVVRTDNNEEQEEDPYARMIALFQDYYSSYRMLLLSNLHLGKPLSSEVMIVIMYWFMNSYLYNRSLNV